VVESAAGARILVDTSTDLRSQLLAAGIAAIDAVVWTHDHADHCHGIDDLRPMRFGRGGAIPGFASEFTVRRLKQREEMAELIDQVQQRRSRSAQVKSAKSV